MTVLRILLVYEATDTTFATQLITDLRTAGAEVTTDSASLDDTAFEEFLSKELPQCQHLIVVQTPEALQSPRVQIVMDSALKQVQAGQMREVLRVIAPGLKGVETQAVPPMWTNTPEFDASQDYPRALARLCLHLGIGYYDDQDVPPPPASLIPPLGIRDSKGTGDKSPVAAPFQAQRSAAEDRPIRPHRYPHVQLRGRLSLLSLVTALVLVVAGIIVFILYGKSTQTTATTPIYPNSIVQKWAFPTAGAVDASPTVVDGVLYIGSHDTNLYAIDVSTGQQKWTFPTKGWVSSPTVLNGVLYVGSNDDNVYAIAASTGQQKWTFPTKGHLDFSPKVVNGVLYIGSGDHTVYAIDATTGQKKWTFPTKGWVGSTPAVANGVLYIGSGDTSVYAIDASTGQKKWTFPTAGWVGSPTVVDGVLYIASDDHTVYAIDATTGQKRWTFPTAGRVRSPTVANGVLYVGSGDNKVYAIDATTGQKKWTFPTGSPVESSPTVVNGVLYIGSDDGNVYAIDASAGQKKWTFSTGSPVKSSPTVVNGVLYVGSDNNSIYALTLPVSSS